MTQDPLASLGFQPRRAGGGLLAPLVWLAGIVATVAALTIGAVLAVFTAVAVAVFALCASVLVFFAGFAMRARRRFSGRKSAPEADVIEAQKVGDTWVTYGWQRPGR